MNTISNGTHLSFMRVSFFCMIASMSVTAMAMQQMQQLAPLDPYEADFSGMIMEYPAPSPTKNRVNFVHAYNNLISEFDKILITAARNEKDIIDKTIETSYKYNVAHKLKLPISIAQEYIDQDITLRHLMIQVLRDKNQYVNACIEHHEKLTSTPIDYSSPEMTTKLLQQLHTINKIAFAATALNSEVNL